MWYNGKKKRPGCIRSPSIYLTTFYENGLRLNRIALLRGKASANDVYEITRQNDCVLLKLSAMNMEKIARAAGHFKGRFVVKAGRDVPHIEVRLLKGEKQLSLIERIFDYMEESDK